MSITDISANDFLMGGGVKSAEFPDRAYGTTWTGTICEQPTVQQQTDLKTGELKFWKSDGKPMMQLVVNIQTEVRDPQLTDDDGKRALYVKAKLQAAVRDAVRASGAKGLEIGGTLSVTYTGDGVQEQKGFNPPKLYSATYAPPAAVAANQFIQGGQAVTHSATGTAPGPWPQGAPAVPAQQYAPPAAQPAYVPPAPAPAAPVAQAEAAAPFVPPVGMDPAVAAAMAMLTPEQRAQMGLPA